MNNKTLMIASERIDQILTEKNTEIERRREQLHELMAERDRLRADADRALARGDDESFSKATQALHIIEDKIHFHSSRIETFNNEAFVSDEEYQDLRGIIEKGLETANAKARDEIVKKFDEIFQIGDEIDNTIKEGNVLLRKWEDTTNHTSKLPGGRIRYADYQGYSLVQFLMMLRSMPEYQYLRRDGWRSDGR